jgi:hypothetical protein
MSSGPSGTTSGICLTAPSAEASATVAAGGSAGRSCFTIGGQGRGSTPIGMIPLLRARKSFCGAEPLGTGPE